MNAEERAERAQFVRSFIDRDTSQAGGFLDELSADVLALAAELRQAREQLREAKEHLRDALPSIGANQRGYAQRALEGACAMLGENPEAWRGGGSLSLVKDLEAQLREAEGYAQGLKHGHEEVLRERDAELERLRDAAKGAVEFARPVDLDAAVIQGGFPDLRAALSAEPGEQ